MIKVNNNRTEIIAEVVTRQNLDVDISNRQKILVEITPRYDLEAEIMSRQTIEALVEIGVIENGYTASVQNKTLILEKGGRVNGSELILNG